MWNHGCRLTCLAEATVSARESSPSKKKDTQFQFCFHKKLAISKAIAYTCFNKEKGKHYESDCIPIIEER